MTDIEQLLLLIRRIEEKPEDEEARAVVGDWAESHGLFTERSQFTHATRVYPFESATLYAGNTHIVRVRPFEQTFYMRGIHFVNTLADCLGVTEVFICSPNHTLELLTGKRIEEPEAFGGVDLSDMESRVNPAVIPGSYFRSESNLYARIDKGSFLALRLLNSYGADIYFTGCIFGN